MLKVWISQQKWVLHWAVKGRGFFLIAVGGFGLKSAQTYSLVEPSIWVLQKHPRYVLGTEFILFSNSTKIFGAHALARAHQQNILPKCQKKANFSIFMESAYERAPRAQVRARPKFFWNSKKGYKISVQFFSFVNISKIDDFSSS